MKRGHLVEELRSEAVSHADLEAIYLQHMRA
jgi:ABC-2 type transport system ATP-binding protein